MFKLPIILGAALLSLGAISEAPAQTFNQSNYAIPLAGIAGGAAPYHYISAATTNATVVKAAKGTVYTLHAVNPNAWPQAFLHLYDKATAPVCGTDVPVHTYVLVQNAPLNIIPTTGVLFINGISFCVTGGIGDTDATNAPANVAVNMDYR